MPDSAVSGHHGYPILFTWLLSRLPRDWWLTAGYLSNALTDIIVGIGVFAAG